MVGKVVTLRWWLNLSTTLNHMLRFLVNMHFFKCQASIVPAPSRSQSVVKLTVVNWILIYSYYLIILHFWNMGDHLLCCWPICTGQIQPYNYQIFFLFFACCIPLPNMKTYLVPLRISGIPTCWTVSSTFLLLSYQISFATNIRAAARNCPSLSLPFLVGKMISLAMHHRCATGFSQVSY